MQQNAKMANGKRKLVITPVYNTNSSEDGTRPTWLVSLVAAPEVAPFLLIADENASHTDVVGSFVCLGFTVYCSSRSQP